MDPNPDKLKNWLISALFIVPSAYFVNFIYALKKGGSGGTFGDTFGAANALFSGTALLMLVYAVILQREELNEVKQERNDTRKILVGQKKLNELQEATLKKQIFDQVFFSLIAQFSNEAISLDRPFKDGSSTTLAQRNSIHAQSFNNDFSGYGKYPEIPRYMYVTLPFCRQATMLFNYSNKARAEDREELILAIRSVFDFDLAEIFLAWSCASLESEPELARAFVGLRIEEISAPDRIGTFKSCANRLESLLAA